MQKEEKKVKKPKFEHKSTAKDGPAIFEVQRATFEPPSI